MCSERNIQEQVSSSQVDFSQERFFGHLGRGEVLLPCDVSLTPKNIDFFADDIDKDLSQKMQSQ